MERSIEAPKYVKMMDVYSNSICLRLIKKDSKDPNRNYKRDIYYRDAGAWECYFEKRGDGFYSVDAYDGKHPQLVGRRLFPVSKQEWEEDNGDYV